jgi:cell division protein FtsQ
MKPIFKYIFISIFALIVLGYMVFSLLYFSENQKEQVCRDFYIVLADSDKIQLISQKDIAVILDQNNLNPVGKTLKYIRTESIEEVLHKNPMIKVAECYTTPSGEVYVKINQRCPKFRVVGLGSYYVDVDRKTMPISSNYGAYIPVVSGRVTVSMATTKLFDFVTYLEQNPFWNAQIEQIYVRDDRKIELIPRVGESTIVLGTLDNYAAKLEKLRKLYVHGFSVIGWNKYKIIDLQYKDQVVCDKLGFQPIQPKVVVAEKKDSIISNKL